MQYVQFSKNIQASPGILNTASHVTSSQLPSDVHNHMTPVLRYTRPSTTNSCPTQIAKRTFSSWLSSSLHTGTTLWPPLWARSRALGVLGRTDSVGGGHPGRKGGGGVRLVGVRYNWAQGNFVRSWRRPTWSKRPAISCYWLLDSAMFMLIKIYLPVVTI